ncbi:iron chelate uptake ABC transporter family permease subunit [Arthrobacter sp. CJ23]|uniref:FecCD family ABC transporter permease n=1 Tax=Arthrobacter sp. CJ23 TaxID=2972479 RepID=UPI00215CF066|nr:iron chelate uptake ABC transporter family permease subunit [Arthrobacter sp. CJ23]UVJ40302.1 iron chelate uptake ABC transporter family permease subunit [Arthrobacter sp. CJ23]
MTTTGAGLKLSSYAGIHAIRAGRTSWRWRPRTVAVSVALAVLVFAAMGVHVAYGGLPLAYGDVLRSLLGDASQPRTYLAVTEFRAPRMVAAVVVGLCLAAAGAITQTVARNPLASPDVLGITSGASLGAVSVLVLAGGGYAGLSGAAATIGLPSAAFAMGLCTGVAAYVLAYRKGLDSYRLVLVGIGLTGLATSLTTWLLTLGDVTNAGQALTWMMGSLNGKDWALVVPMTLLAAPLLLLSFLAGRWLELLSFGDEAAVGLGIRSGRVRVMCLSLAVVLASIATVLAGPLAFVALASPQIARLVCRTAVPSVLPSALTGALFVLLSDTIAAHALPVSLPAGVATAVVGAPYLIYLVLNYQRRLA